jgi:hypothetical protein
MAESFSGGPKPESSLGSLACFHLLQIDGRKMFPSEQKHKSFHISVYQHFYSLIANTWEVIQKEAWWAIFDST